MTKFLVRAIALPLVLTLHGCSLFPRSHPTVELKSAVGADYSHLDRLLQQGLWKDADRETLQKILEGSKRQREKWLSVKDIQQFPCEDLGTIDRLWETRSQGRFGFSVQRMLWKELGGKSGDYNALIAAKFGDRVGWRQNGKWRSSEELMFQKNDAPVGQLPASTGGGVSGAVWGGVASLAQRVEYCNLNITPAKRHKLTQSWQTPATWANLEANLAKREWVTADWVTLKLMEKIASKGKEPESATQSVLTVSALRNFPCQKLKRIDRLWLKYSEGRLGFSVQQQFYLQTGNTPGELHWGK
ncbi:MAG TPA: GUN4 domain-containing protein, partial [Allocoleopsis sp.]